MDFRRSNDNHKVPHKSRALFGGAPHQSGSRINLSRWLYSWAAVCVVLLMVLMVYWVPDIRADERQNDPNASGTQDKTASEPETKGQVAQKSSNGDTVDANLPAEEQELFELFSRFMEASEKDPDSSEAQKLSKQIDETLEKLQEKMERDPGSDLKKLPAAPVIKNGGKKGPDVRSLPTLPDRFKKRAPGPRRNRQGPRKEAPGALSKPNFPELATNGQRDAGIGKPAKTAETKITPSPVEVPAAEREKKPPEEKPVETKPKAEVAEAQVQPKPAPPAEVKKSPDDIVKVSIKDNLLDVAMLIETVGKEFKFTFLYDSEKGVTGKVKLQQYGEFRRRDLLPLLESVLRFKGYSLVRDDPFIRVVQMKEAHKKTAPVVKIGEDIEELAPGDSIVAQIVELKHITFDQAKKFLSKFTNTAGIEPVPGTNQLIITEHTRRLGRLLEMLELIDLPGPPKKLVALEVEYLTVKEAHTRVNELLKALAEQGVDISPEAKAKSRPKPSRDRKRGRPSAKESKAATDKKGAKGPVLIDDERTGRLLVIGTDEQIAQVTELLGIIDLEQPGPEIRLEPVRLEHITAKDAAGLITDLIRSLNEQIDATVGKSTPAAEKGAKRKSRPAKTPGKVTKAGAKGPFLHVDERTNRILIIGTDEQIDQVYQLIALIDVVEGPEIKLVALEIKYVPSTDIAGQLSDLIQALNEPTASGSTIATKGAGPAKGPARGRSRRARTGGGGAQLTQAGSRGPFLLADERTNRLFVVGSDDQIEQVNELLVVLDVPPSEYDQLVLRIYQPQYVEAAEVMRILDQLGITKPERVSPREKARRGERREQRRETTPRETITAPGEGQLLPGQEEPEIRVAVMESTNKIFVLATEYQIRAIEEIMNKVDLDPAEALGAIQIYQLENRKPEDVAAMLEELLESEKIDVEKKIAVPGKEGAPIIVPLDDIYAIAVRGSTKQHQEIKAIIEQLDKRLPQVLVEAILVRVSAGDALKLGISLKNTYSVGGAANTDRRFSGISPFSFTAQRSADSFLVTGTGGTLAFLDDDLVFATLEALQEENNAKIISKPRIMVTDNEAGTITSERQEPTTTTTIPPGSDTPIIDFKGYESAGTSLTITPHISEGNFLQLEVRLSVNSFEGEGSGNVPPAKTNNEIETIVTVPNDMVMVLGGLTDQINSLVVNKIPLLGDLPLIGALFRNVTRSIDRGVLYVFIKANIVRSDTPETENFEDVDELSEKYRNKVKEDEINYQRQGVIPGLPAEERESPGALED